MTPSAVLSALAAHGVKAGGMSADSRTVAPGDIFVALPGKRADGRAFVADAVARGAVAVLHEAGAEIATSVPCLAVPNLAALVGEIANLVYGKPSHRLWMAAVTGTNGKTSTSLWIAQALGHLGRRCAVIGTLGSGFPDQLVEGVNTTPDAVSVQRALARFVGQGAVACAMEASSIGIEAGRINGAHFDVAVFTNLTQDHLDYHGSMAAYAAAKERLFDWPDLHAAVINLDDPFGAELAERIGGRRRTIGYTLEGKVSPRGTPLKATKLAMTAAGIAFELDGVRFEVPVVGRFNASNLLAVVGALLADGHPLTDIAAVVPKLTPPPGRMQSLGGHDAPLVVVDYAHTPDALEKVLTTLRETATARQGRLICVFGCGGERDAGKRPLMGAIAERLADRVVLTSDNPRGEDPRAILDDILRGIKAQVAVEPDRARAIRAALVDAGKRDVVVLAGKGHEHYQEVAGTRQPFSDLDQARAALEQWR
ncbi:MAG TPA: UDP-N-acetylmuramoyl-L-alanyl-D-glutamate--2,6-diaminopimelate ligase [Rhodocyclaceae bacterium]|nr:UDP-N-acetylmuramoyl-L-alanyl-D-glutamate--2,6-diaminopimelate ligase [Rhodocyclaceae bacterium]